MSEFTDLPVLKAPPMSAALSAALESVKPVSLRRPKRDLILFSLLSLPFFAAIVLIIGLRRDISGLSPLWLGTVGLVWFTSFSAAAYLGFVPAKGHIAPRSRSIYQVVLASSAVVIAIGLLAVQEVPGASMTYPSTMDNLVSHAGACARMGLGIGIFPGVLAILIMRRYVPVGRISVGLSLGAAGGSLGGLALMLHCPISESLHVGIVHGSCIVISAFFVAAAGQILLRERS
ncbi:MAG: DUF1109 family protein [Kofleriaceae bacterium]|nr:DUF1109 family protein [Kofleriaceae bacterium]